MAAKGRQERVLPETRLDRGRTQSGISRKRLYDGPGTSAADRAQRCRGRVRHSEDISLLGVIVNKQKKRADQMHWIEKINANFGDLVFEPMLQDREVFAKAQAAAQPLRAWGSEAAPHRADLVQLATQIWKGAES